MEESDKEVILWSQIILILMLSVGVLLGELGYFEPPQPGAHIGEQPPQQLQH